MSIKTEIQWCDSTVNPVMGCWCCELWQPDNGVEACYAGILHGRHGGLNSGYAPKFDQPTEFAGRMQDAARWPDLRGRRRPDKPWLDGLPRLVFVSDMGDALSPGIEFAWLRREVIDVVQSENGLRHCWLWLSKRPERMAQFSSWLKDHGQRWPVNLWAGTSLTTQDSLARAQQLKKVGDSKTIRFLSVEPQWESIDLEKNLKGISWVIQGGQSGGGAKPFQLDWAHALKHQCENASVAYFLKQLGAAPEEHETRIRVEDGHGGDWSEWPRDLRVREMPEFATAPALIRTKR